MINISIARFLDRRIGIAICAALDYFSRFSRRGRIEKPLDDVRRVLVIKFWGLGNLVEATPAFRAIRNRFSIAKITLLTLERNRGLFDASPLFDEIIYMKDVSVVAVLEEFLALIARLRRTRFDIVFDMDPIGRFCAIVTFLTGAPARAGFSTANQHREQLYTSVVPLNEDLHVRKIFLGLPECIGIDSSDDSLMKLSVAPGVAKSVDVLLEREGVPPDARLVIVNVNASEVAFERRWPRERFVEVAERIAGLPGVVVAFTGAPGEVQYVAGAASAMKSHFVNFAGKTSLAEMVELIGRAALFISNDSGPMHVAVAMGAPTIALFGPETPRRYGPIGDQHTVFFATTDCAPCITFTNEKQVKCRRNAECMMRISVEDVWNAAKASLEK